MSLFPSNSPVGSIPLPVPVFVGFNQINIVVPSPKRASPTNNDIASIKSLLDTIPFIFSITSISSIPILISGSIGLDQIDIVRSIRTSYTANNITIIGGVLDIKKSSSSSPP
jgi:hypothetical protein